MHNAFLTRYFGEQKAVLAFAKTLIAIGRKDAAKALNEAVRVLGDDLDPALVINKIKGRFGLFEDYQRQNGADSFRQPSHSPEAPKAHPRPPNAIDAGNENCRAARMSKIAARPGATVGDLRNAIDELGGSFIVHGDGCSIHALAGC